jgi:diadenosine tetraphosphate (Ap4A) HIT family hydrolase
MIFCALSTAKGMIVKMSNYDLYSKIIEPYINGTATSCSYCDFLEPLIIYEGKYIYVTVAIGQIIPGYTQISVKKHRTAITGLYDFETKELIKIKSALKKAYEEVYGVRGIAFEHGQTASCLWGADYEKNEKTLCYHAHIHFIPVNIDIRSAIEKYIPVPSVINDIWELKQIREDVLQGEPYLYYEDENDIGYVYPVSDDCFIPRQFLRSCVAEVLNLSERTDWIASPGIEYFEETKQLLTPAISKYLK